MKRIFLGFMAIVPIATLIGLGIRYPAVGMGAMVIVMGALLLYLIGMIVEEVFY